MRRAGFGAGGEGVPVHEFDLQHAAAATLFVLESDAGRAALSSAFEDAFGVLAPVTYARHLSALRSAVRWWHAAGWLSTDPTAGASCSCVHHWWRSRRSRLRCLARRVGQG